MTSLAFVFAALLAAEPNEHTAKARLSFLRDVRPILADNCFACHGQDPQQRKGKLRLDVRTQATASKAIVSGKPQESELVERISTTDPDSVMPPIKTQKKLTPEQTEILRRWIAEGAEYEGHWAFAPLKRPTPPEVKNAAWVRNPIDRFVLARLEREALSPTAEADRTTLIRRLSLDLLGLPPTPSEVAAFAADPSPNAYEKLVDRLLASPHYGERMALPWLDAARYADSNGFQQDGDTFQYVWRDWVVQALNADVPFDRFTIEQLAGDLLPKPTLNQQVATGFNRCHLLNGEGGAIAEEQRNNIVFDRVDVTATTWLGLTLACAQCHDHKYDPLTQRDYYRLFAFFNKVPESGVPSGSGQYRIADPFVYVGDEKLKELDAKAATAKREVERRERSAETIAAFARWESAASVHTSARPMLGAWRSIGPFHAESFDAAFDTPFVTEKAVDLLKTYEGGKLKWRPRPEWTDGKEHYLENDPNAATYLYRIIETAGPMKLPVSFGSDDGIKVWLNEAEVLTNKVTRAVGPDQEKRTLSLKAGRNRLLVKIVNGGGLSAFYFRADPPGLPPDLQDLLKLNPSARSAAQKQRLLTFFLLNAPPPAVNEARHRQRATESERDAARAALPRVMVMSDANPRKTHILDRGNYEAPRAEVDAGTPESLPPLPKEFPKNRLGLAKWLVGLENPLTARVQVNRHWQLFFGKGLVKTTENLGTQSEPPIHPELLDWLAAEFRDTGWSMKRLHRLIVTSATYRQSSKTTPALRARDPENLLYARGVRRRMSSLLLRDVALASSGLLDQRIGGKPVYPYQPKGIWDGLAITNERDFTYPQSTGADLYRRSIYTFWRRTVAPGNMFDASTRTTCQVKPSLTSTPLHALTTMNDATWVEAGRALAERVMQEAGSSPNARLTEAFRRVCARTPAADEVAVLRRGYERALAVYRRDPKAASEYLAIGASPRDRRLDPVEHAAYASACLSIYNLDEALTRE